jgi:hypothetical protein
MSPVAAHVFDGTSGADARSATSKPNAAVDATSAVTEVSERFIVDSFALTHHLRKTHEKRARLQN